MRPEHDRPMLRSERLVFAFILTLLVITATCTSCISLGRGGSRSATTQYGATVLISTTCKNALGMTTLRGRGSGVVISAHHVLTAHHVVDCGGDVAVLTIDPGNGAAYEATTELVMPVRDIARLELKVSLAKYSSPIKIGPRPEIGERVCESSAVPRWLYRCGEVQPNHTDSTYIYVGFMAEFGNSGSGVYVDGKLVGLLSTAWFCQENYPCVGGVTPLQGLDWLIP